jgi:hypothetical protein
MRSSIFWSVTSLILVIIYRRFGTSYGSHLLDLPTSHLQGGLIGCSETSLTTNLRRVTSRKSERSQSVTLPTLTTQTSRILSFVFHERPRISLSNWYNTTFGRTDVSDLRYKVEKTVSFGSKESAQWPVTDDTAPDALSYKLFTPVELVHSSMKQ